jgi:Domain of unknown function (DUF4214)
MLNISLAMPKSVEELLARQDIDFVKSAYRVVLGRDPDQSGFEHYLYLVRAGKCKNSILADIARSPEGRSKPQTLSGLTDFLVSYEQKTNLLERLRQITQLPELPKYSSEASFQSQTNAALCNVVKLLEKSEQSTLLQQVTDQLADLVHRVEWQNRAILEVQQKSDKQAQLLGDLLVSLLANSMRSMQISELEAYADPGKVTEKIDAYRHDSQIGAHSLTIKDRLEVCVKRWKK